MAFASVFTIVLIQYSKFDYSKYKETVSINEEEDKKDKKNKQNNDRDDSVQVQARGPRPERIKNEDAEIIQQRRQHAYDMRKAEMIEGRSLASDHKNEEDEEKIKLEMDKDEYEELKAVYKKERLELKGSKTHGTFKDLVKSIFPKEAREEIKKSIVKGASGQMYSEGGKPSDSYYDSFNEGKYRNVYEVGDDNKLIKIGSFWFDFIKNPTNPTYMFFQGKLKEKSKEKKCCFIERDDKKIIAARGSPMFIKWRETMIKVRQGRIPASGPPKPKKFFK